MALRNVSGHKRAHLVPAFAVTSAGHDAPHRPRPLLFVSFFSPFVRVDDCNNSQRFVIRAQTSG